jgi:type III secretion protein Q
MKTISNSSIQPNRFVGLQQMSALFARAQTQISPGKRWDASDNHRWQRFELTRADLVENEGLLNGSEAADWVTLHCDGEVAGCCDIRLVQLVSGITWDSRWPETTVRCLLEMAGVLWDPDLLQAMGGQLQLIASSHFQPSDDWQRCRLTLVAKETAHRHVHSLHLPSSTIMKWLQNPQWHPMNANPMTETNPLWSLMSCRGQWLLGQTLVDLHSLAALRSGDAVFIDSQALDPPGSARCLFDGWLLYLMKHEEHSWICKGWKNMGNPQAQNILGTMDGETKSDESLQRLSCVDDIAVSLVFTVGHISLPMRQLLSLSIGQVIELQQPTSTRVMMSVNGCHIGMGELIDIEGRLAIEVLTMASST